jgi:hypothetical protein
MAIQSCPEALEGKAAVRVKGRGGHSAEVCCGAERGENGAGGLFQHPLKILGWSYIQLRGGMRSGS